MKNPLKTAYKQAFTLIELLVVIAIIGILAALLLPNMKGMRDNAKNSACISNQKQVGVGLLAFAQDQGGKLPPPSIYDTAAPFLFGGGLNETKLWSDTRLAGQYMGNIQSHGFCFESSPLWCPADLQPHLYGSAPNNNIRLISYGINQNIYSQPNPANYFNGTNPDKEGVNRWWQAYKTGLERFQSPAKTILTIDSYRFNWSAGSNYHNPPPTYDIPEPFPTTNFGTGNPTTALNYVKRHLKKTSANFLFVDGHVTSSSTLKDDLETGKYFYKLKPRTDPNEWWPAGF